MSMITKHDNKNTKPISTLDLHLDITCHGQDSVSEIVRDSPHPSYLRYRVDRGLHCRQIDSHDLIEFWLEIKTRPDRNV